MKRALSQMDAREVCASLLRSKTSVWCKSADYWDVWQSTVRATKLALDEAGIGIPFPQQDVHFDETVVKALSN